MPLHFLIIGSGFAGSVLARELADNLECTIDIWEEKNHIVGNCFHFKGTNGLGQVSFKRKSQIIKIYAIQRL